LRTLTLAIALFAIASSPAAAGELFQSFPAGPNGTLVVSLDRGEVEVVAHDEREVRIEAVSRGLGAGGVHFEAAADGKQVRLTGSDESWLHWIAPGPSVSVRIHVPPDFAVRVATNGDDVTVEGVRRGVTAQTSRASIRLIQVAGRVELRTGRGRYETRAQAGDAVALTLSESGRIHQEHGLASRRVAVPGGALGLQDVRR
jgi:hypothetical protein